MVWVQNMYMLSLENEIHEIPCHGHMNKKFGVWKSGHLDYVRIWSGDGDFNLQKNWTEDHTFAVGFSVMAVFLQNCQYSFLADTSFWRSYKFKSLVF